MLPFPVFTIVVIALAKRLWILSGRRPGQLFLHRDHVSNALRALATHRDSLESFQANLAIGYELHRRHL